MFEPRTITCPHCQYPFISMDEQPTVELQCPGCGGLLMPSGTSTNRAEGRDQTAASQAVMARQPTSTSQGITDEAGGSGQLPGDLTGRSPWHEQEKGGWHDPSSPPTDEELRAFVGPSADQYLPSWRGARQAGAAGFNYVGGFN